jgi:hypothetical protein
MTLRKLVLSVVTAGFLFVGSAVQAASYSFGTILSGNSPSPVHFADLDINDNGNGSWSFSLFNIDLSAFGSNSFIGSMAVDGTKATSVTDVTGGGVAVVGLNPGSGPGGDFDFRYVFGGGSDKLVNAETVSWTAWGLGGALPTDGQLALHVQGIGPNDDSAWYISPVPEPETYAMMLIGLGLIGFSLRNKNR